MTDRRSMLQGAVRMACAMGTVGLGLGLHARQVRALPPQALRPPGVHDEAAFQAACVRCGLCVRDCPYDILRLATPGQAVALGTPWFTARDKPCEMCPDLPCVQACPTGALDPGLTDVNRARMGLAVLIDHEQCLNWLGLRCDICYRVCPVIDKAITLEQQANTRTGKHAQFIPTVHSDACTGCGKCEKACPLQVAAIKVLPRPLAQAAPAAHYRLGWQEKNRAGGSLVAPEPEHRYNLPDGLHYDNGRVEAGGAPASAPAAPSAPASTSAAAPTVAPGPAPRSSPGTPGTPTPPPAAPPRALHGDRL